jgi:hypothetical protein
MSEKQQYRLGQIIKKEIAKELNIATLLGKMQEYRRNWTGLWTKCRNTGETGNDFGQNAGIQKKLDRTLDKMQEYRRNWIGLQTKCRNTEETGQALDKMQEYRRNWTGLWTKCRNTEENGQDKYTEGIVTDC